MTLLEKFRIVLADQWAMAQHFYGDPQTRTPIFIIWIASFGGALHASVTTFFYLECGASDMDIGRLGFVQSLGSLILAPMIGYAMDHGVPVFGPLIVTATCCSVGCLWRGLATSVWGLYLASPLLATGTNLWTVVLLHVSRCTPRDHISHVLSGYAVQETGLRLLGKIVFPLFDYVVRILLKMVPAYDTTLFRYRIHMGVCSIFCVYGTIRLLIERSALQQSTLIKEEPTAHSATTIMDGPPSSPNSHGTHVSLEVNLAAPEETSQFTPSHLATALQPPLRPASGHFRYVAILGALLIQSWSSTVLVVLWPLVLRDQFQFTATEYGMVMVVASICSTSAIASFPAVEHHLGRIRTAATGATVAAAACALAFVAIPNLMHIHEEDLSEDGTNPNAVPVEPNENSRLWVLNLFLLHAILAIVFESSVRMLEPSLKSIISLTVPVSAQNRSLGFMSTLGGLGGMGGNLMGTWLFHTSNQFASVGITGIGWLGNGTLPFVTVTGVLALASLFLWLLEWQETQHHHHHHHHHAVSNALSLETFCEEMGNSEKLTGNDPSSPHPVAATTVNHTQNTHKNDRGLFPLLQKETSYEMKLD